MQHTQNMQLTIAFTLSTCVDHNLEMYLQRHVFSLQHTFLVLKTGNPPQISHPSTMTPEAITLALAAAQGLFFPINREPSHNILVRLSNAILPILLKSTYYHINGVHNLWGLVANKDRYLHHYNAPFVCPATRPACYDPAINTEASCINRVCAKTTWAAKIQDYKAFEAAECGVKVFIKAVVQDTWICNLRNPEMFYSNDTALALFNHLCDCSGGLHD